MAERKVHLLNEPKTGTRCGRYLRPGQTSTDRENWLPRGLFIKSLPARRCGQCVTLEMIGLDDATETVGPPVTRSFLADATAEEMEAAARRRALHYLPGNGDATLACGETLGKLHSWTSDVPTFLAGQRERCGACLASAEWGKSAALHAKRAAAEIAPLVGHAACGCKIVGAGDAPDPLRIEPCIMHRAPRRDDSAAALAGALDGFAIRLNKAPPCRAVERGSCLRGTTERVAYGDRSTREMCEACAALWHVQMAVEHLRRIATLEAQEAVEKNTTNLRLDARGRRARARA